uniref:Trimeric intracellular cation channel type A n=1 Tax=Pan troglodytes TaxID=9598 RepID=A0A2I3TJM9_PANTR
ASQEQSNCPGATPSHPGCAPCCIASGATSWLICSLGKAPCPVGSGVALMSNFEQLLRGVWKPETNEILHMSFPTKASLYGAILFTLQQTRWLPVSKASLIFIFTMFMVSCKVFLTATHSHSSPFDALEGYICPVLFGSACGGDHHHDNHGGSHSGGGPGAQHSAMPAKSKEELSEGSRKKKAKKAD